MKRYIIIFGVLMMFGFMLTSCQEDFEPGDAGSKTLSGDWVVQYYAYEANKADLVASYGPYTVQIYNTSFDVNSIWVENIWDDGIKVKGAKLTANTFSVTKGQDVKAKPYAGTIDISEAQVINNDSIIYRVVLTKADGTIEDDYYAAGHRYTGWDDDMH